MVELWCTFSLRHVLVTKGRVIATGQEFIIANVYAPCDTAMKHDLWNRIMNFILNIGDVNFCICGDFNSVRSETERKGRSVVFRQLDTNNFNNFIDGILLIDLPLCGRMFTWYRGDGISMSRLDRFLLSTKWCDSWPNCIQVAC